MSDARFLRVGKYIVPVADIQSINTNEIEQLKLSIEMKNRRPFVIEGPDAIDLIMKTCPSVLEGRRLRFIRNQWWIHNLVGHPVMQICAWLGLHKLGMEIHERTTPRPVGKK